MRELFWQRFDLGELCGENTIKGIAEVNYEIYKEDIEGLTMLVMVINHKSWNHHNMGNDKLCSLYANLYYKYYEKAIDYLEENNREEDLRYFIRTLD